MKLSTKGRYATRIMVHLARSVGSGCVHKREIAENENITKDYVAQLMIPLKSAGLVTSQRGARGGFVLARPSLDITVLDVLNAVEGEIEIAPCVNETCSREARCTTRRFWIDVAGALDKILSSTTIQDLVDEETERYVAAPASYDI